MQFTLKYITTTERKVARQHGIQIHELRICPPRADIYFLGLQLGVRGLQWAVHERSTFVMCIRLLHKHELQFVGQRRACGASKQKYTEWVFHRICEFES